MDRLSKLLNQQNTLKSTESSPFDAKKARPRSSHIREESKEDCIQDFKTLGTNDSPDGYVRRRKRRSTESNIE